MNSLTLFLFLHISILFHFLKYVLILSHIISSIFFLFHFPSISLQFIFFLGALFLLLLLLICFTNHRYIKEILQTWTYSIAPKNTHTHTKKKQKTKKKTMRQFISIWKHIIFHQMMARKSWFIFRILRRCFFHIQIKHRWNEHLKLLS